ncbi:MAG TPA: hypothetical protein VFN23_06135, partial [Ktedonobacteraceae bacterium]|nr:hypothetical protein [Ktedonobacteraceae bacterium]
MLNTKLDWREIDSLIMLLNKQGITYLWGNGSATNEDSKDVTPTQLIQRLAACNYPLVEHASISLFILHPEFAPAIIEALKLSPDDVAENIAVMTLATLYLQQWWFFRLTTSSGKLPDFPETPFASLWEERHLPPPDDGYGMTGLLASQDYQQHRYGLPLNFLDDWQNQINHLFAQEEAHTRKISNEIAENLVQLSRL